MRFVGSRFRSACSVVVAMLLSCTHASLVAEEGGAAPGVDGPTVSLPVSFSELATPPPVWKSVFFEDRFTVVPEGSGAAIDGRLAAERAFAESTFRPDTPQSYLARLALLASSDSSDVDPFTLDAGAVDELTAARSLSIEITNSGDWHATGVFRFHGHPVAGAGCILFFDAATKELLGRFHATFDAADFPSTLPLPALSATGARAAFDAAVSLDTHRRLAPEPALLYSTQLRRFAWVFTRAVDPDRVDVARIADLGYFDVESFWLDATSGALLAIERFGFHGEVRGQTVAQLPANRRGTSVFAGLSEQVVPRVTVRYEHPELPAAAVTTSDDDGRFAFTDVPEGGELSAEVRNDAVILTRGQIDGAPAPTIVRRTPVAPGAGDVAFELSDPIDVRDPFVFPGTWVALHAANAFDRRLRAHSPLTRPRDDEIHAAAAPGENVFVRTFVSHLPTPDGAPNLRGHWNNAVGISTIHAVGGSDRFADHAECFAMMAHEKGHEVLALLSGHRVRTGTDIDDAFSEAFAHLFGWFVHADAELADGRVPETDRWIVGMERPRPNAPMCFLTSGDHDPVDTSPRLFSGARNFFRDRIREFPVEWRMLPTTGLFINWARLQQRELAAARQREQGPELAALSAWQDAIEVPVRSLYTFASLFRGQPSAAIPEFTPETARVVHFLIPFVEGGTRRHQELFEIEAEDRDFRPFFGNSFVRGDANLDGFVEVSDAVTALLFLFGPLELECEDAADANDDGELNVADPIRVLRSLFGGAPALPPPLSSHCGPDLTIDAVHCATALSSETCR